MKIHAIAFDADDTLWHNEDWFASTEDSFAKLMQTWACEAEARRSLLDTETRNLAVFGYGVKSFTLSMIEAAMTLSGGDVSAHDLAQLMELGRAMLERPAELLPNVRNVLSALDGQHRLVLITKGELHHQERKVAGSGLAEFFDAVEVVSEKDSTTYARLAQRHGIEVSGLVMVGNSVKSDILPIVELGGVGIHIPYSVTWAHEVVADDHLHTYERNADRARYWELQNISEVPSLIDRLLN